MRKIIATKFPTKIKGIIHNNLFFIGFFAISNKTTNIDKSEKTIETDRKILGVINPKCQCDNLNNIPIKVNTKPIIDIVKITFLGISKG